MRKPNYLGSGLVNLVAELERRLTGSAVCPGLEPGFSEGISDADTYVLVLFDGLGDLQLSAHPDGGRLIRDRIGALDASFSSQTSVATATLATGLPPARHGLISYMLRLGVSAKPVNTLWWLDTDGNPVDIELSTFLPAPNLAERLITQGVEVVVVQPRVLIGSPLDQVLFRGVRTRGVGDAAEMAPAVLEEAATPGKMVVCYLPFVDTAGHAEGTKSAAYSTALRLVTEMWESIGERLADHAALVGTADHGMVDLSEHVAIEPPSSLTLYGDSRVVYVAGDSKIGRELSAHLPATWVSGAALDCLWGPGPRHTEFETRRPDGLMVADMGIGFTYPGNDLKLVGDHGGLTEEELRIPLLSYRR